MLLSAIICIPAEFLLWSTGKESNGLEIYAERKEKISNQLLLQVALKAEAKCDISNDVLFA